MKTYKCCEHKKSYKPKKAEKFQEIILELYDESRF